MPKTKPTDNILKQFAKLQKQAEKHVQTAKKAIEKKIAREVAAVHKKYAAELKKLDSIVSGFTGGSKASKMKAATGAKRTRRTLPKVTDEQIKDAVSKIAAGGKKVTSAAIFTAANITRPRFNEFLKTSNGFLTVEGNKRSTVYFLKV